MSHPNQLRRTCTAGVVMAGAVAMTLTACGGSSTESASGGGGVAAVVKGLDNPFFQSMESGIKDQATTDGVQVTVQAANSITDTTGQADKLNGLATQNFSCFVVNPITGTNLIQGVAQLSAKNIPIVNIDSPIDPEAAKAANAKIATYIGTDNKDAGAQAAAEMARLLPQGGTVALVGGTAGDVTSAARLDGFTAAAPANLTDHLDGGRRLGTPNGAHQGDRRDDRQSRPRRVLRRQRRHGPRRRTGHRERRKDRADQGDQRRRQQGRVPGGEVRRTGRRGRAVPIRDRRDGCRGMQGRLGRQGVAREGQRTGSGGDQGQRRRRPVVGPEARSRPTTTRSRRLDK